MMSVKMVNNSRGLASHQQQGGGVKPGGDLYLGPGQQADGAALLQVGGGVDRPAHQQPRPVWREREGALAGREGLQAEGHRHGQTVPTHHNSGVASLPGLDVEDAQPRLGVDEGEASVCKQSQWAGPRSGNNEPTNQFTKQKNLNNQ